MTSEPPETAAQRAPPADRPRAGRVLFRMLGRLAISMGLMCGLLWIAFHDQHPGEIWERAQGIHRGWLLTYCVLVALFQELRILAWAIVLKGQGKVSWGRALAVGNFGQTLVYLLPLRLGEFVRPALIAADGRISFGAVSATVALERIIDALVVSVILLVTVILLPPSGVQPWFVRSAWLIAGSFTGLSLAIGACVIWLRQVEALIKGTVGRVLPGLAVPLVLQARAFAHAIRTFVSKPRIAIPYLILILVVWVVYGYKVFALYLAMGIDQGFMSTYTLLGAAVVGQSVPGGPGAAGAFHTVIRYTLEAYGESQARAISFATVMHLFQTVVLTLTGVAGWLLGRIRLSQLGALRRQFSAGVARFQDEDTRTSPGDVAG